MNQTIVKTLHIGLRTEPLGEDILNEELLYPPIPNIYCRWLLACSVPSIEDFWSGEFQGANWPAGKLLNYMEIMSYNQWEKMSPERLMEIFRNWPTMIEYRYDRTGGLWYGPTQTDDLLVRVPMSEVMAVVDYEALRHIRDMDLAERMRQA